MSIVFAIILYYEMIFIIYIHTYILYLFQKQTIYTNKTKKKSTSRKGSLEVSPMRRLPQIKEKQK